MTLRIIDDENMPNFKHPENGYSEFVGGVDTMKEYIESMPVLSDPKPDLDIEKVIRCRDCVFAEWNEYRDPYKIHCRRADWDIYMRHDNYCSQACRRGAL